MLALFASFLKYFSGSMNFLEEVVYKKCNRSNPGHNYVNALWGNGFQMFGMIEKILTGLRDEGAQTKKGTRSPFFPVFGGNGGTTFELFRPENAGKSGSCKFQLGVVCAVEGSEMFWTS